MGIADWLRRHFVAEPTGPTPETALSPPPDPFRQQPPPKPVGMPSSVRQTALSARTPSALAGAWFDAEFDLTWQSLPGGEQRHSRPEDLVRAYAYELVAQVTATHSVTAVTAAQAEANRQLGWVREIEGVVSMRGSVDLSVAPLYQQAAEEHERLQRDRQAGRLRRELETEEIEHLRSVAFDQLTSARIWWVLRYPERVGEIAELDGVFARLCGVEPDPPVAVTPLPPRSGGAFDSVGWQTLERVAAVLEQLDDTSRDRLVELANHVAGNFGRTLTDEQRPPVTAPETAMVDAVPDTIPTERTDHDLPPVRTNGTGPIA
ncbi:hypothetical protein [Streptoalloteichus hindustanus]|uniref:Uncharacterized protein n=1 Tax=Streptoalloteichus hindustanus TaxID=2017 RepID=A0A1M5K1H9_STRHI|nr:hypothetical protein [Streptoalloteichus hindustanus]SHG46359.1 hypothetical protein SAMN05444320_109103 [Streptoalloteichus hindustanus]